VRCTDPMSTQTTDALFGASRFARLAMAGLLVLELAGCGDRATLPVSAGFGPHPVLPAPHPTRFPTINFAHAVGWPAAQRQARRRDLR